MYHLLHFMYSYLLRNSPRFVDGYKNNEINYPDFMDHLLPFASGIGYALSKDLVQYIVNQEQYLIKYYNEVLQHTWINNHSGRFSGDMVVFSTIDTVSSRRVYLSLAQV